FNVRAHHDLADAPARVAARHDKFKESHAATPNVSGPAAEFFKSPRRHRARREAIKYAAIRFVDNFRERPLVNFVARKRKLPRHQMLLRIEQRRRRRSIDQRTEYMRGATNFCN